MTPEGKSSQAVRVRASAWGVTLLRNNSGVLPDRDGRPVRFGLGNESKKLNQELKTGDFVGWTPLTITADMVGKQVAIFTNIEAKAFGFKERDNYNPNTREYGQNKFNQLVIDAGGLAGFATGSADIDKLIQEYVVRMKNYEK